jgi:hypothetical protein
MSEEASTAAAALAMRYNAVMNAVEVWTPMVRSALLACFSAGFVFESRKLFAIVERSDAELLVASLESLSDVSHGPVARTQQIVAVRGERVVLVQRWSETTDGSVTETLALVLLDPQLRIESIVYFDPHQMEAASELLDEMAAAHPEPVEPGAFEAAMARFDELEGAIRRANAG